MLTKNRTGQMVQGVRCLISLPLVREVWGSYPEPINRSLPATRHPCILESRWCKAAEKGTAHS